MLKCKLDNSVIYITSKQFIRFSKLMQDLVDKNLYYKCNLSNVGLPRELSEFVEFYKQLPCMNKTEIKSNYEKYISIGTTEEVSIELTSGTTGVPLRCLKSMSERRQKSLSVWARRRKIDPALRVEQFVDLLGRSPDPSIDFTVTTSQNMHKVINYLINKNPSWLCASPSLIYRYAQFIENNPHYMIPNLKFVELQGEHMNVQKRRYVEEVLNVRTVMNYGNRESWCIAYECPAGHMHVMQSLCFLEERAVTGSNDNRKELLITDLVNRVMPFVRYSTGDYGTLRVLEQCECGEYDVIEVSLTEAREAKYIDGHPSIIGNLFFKRVIHSVIRKRNKDVNIINEFKVIQKSKEQFVFMIIPGTSFDKYRSEVLSEINEMTKQKLGNVDVVVQLVDYIPLSRSGKRVLFEKE